MNQSYSGTGRDKLPSQIWDISGAKEQKTYDFGGLRVSFSPIFVHCAALFLGKKTDAARMMRNHPG
ncbi:hypothetical protein ACFO5Q_03725 [Kordiimonas lipolytica]|uniref:Uncharacterized protein n=1 Tax=Kordiimonas lipolytica TaxID=1662421 RepID=A0ABV8U7R7_9PROT|nr:hypothetical protein [Kordiimonas lipolytica]